MKKIFLSLICFVLLSVSSPTLAQDSIDTIDFCIALSELASSIMDGRQSGVLISDMIKGIIYPEDHYLYLMTLQMIVKAYETEKYSLDENRKQVISNFSKEYFKACIIATSNQL
jgi:hypothetical protein